MKKTVLILVVLLMGLHGALAQSDVMVLARVSGELTADDEKYGGATVDWIELTIPEDGRVEVVAVSVDGPPIIFVRDSDGFTQEREGRQFGAAYGGAFEAGDHVRIGVGLAKTGQSGWLGSPQYTLQVLVRVGGLRLTVGGSLSGNLGPGDEQYSDGTYIDWYELTVDAGVRLRVDVTSSDFDTYLVVEDPDGISYENDDTNGTDSSVSFTPGSSGVARVGVRSYGTGGSGNYELSAGEETVLSLQVGEVVTGFLETPTQVFLLDGFPDQVVEIRVSSSDFDTTLTVEDADGTYLYNDDYSDSINSLVTYVFGPTGTATVTVGGYGGQGGYIVEVRESTDRYDNPVDGYELRSGEVVNARLTPRASQADGTIAQRFTFYAQQGDRIEITLESNSFDSYLRLIDPNGRETTDDDSAGNLNSRITYTVRSPGMHEVYAQSLGGSETGLYTITYLRLDDVQSILEMRGQLTPNDPVDETGKAFDVIRVSLTAGVPVTIDVTSGSFDTLIKLQNPSGAIVASDDDGGTGSNSRIRYTANRSGSFELVVSSFSAGSYGNYAVSVFE